MPRRSPYIIMLSRAEARELRRRAAHYTLPYFQVQRAKMILLAADGLSNDEISGRLDTRREVVSMWRKRFFEERLAGLEERSRPGRPPVFSPQSWSFKLKRWLVNCRPLMVSRCRVGAWPTLECRSGNPDSSPGSAIARSGVGSMRMRSALGATAVGSFLAIRILPSRPDGYWISTNASGTRKRSAMTNSWSRPMRKPVCRPGDDGMPRSRLSPARR